MNLEQLKDRILHSGDFTALEKRYLEERIEGESTKSGKWVKGIADGESYHCSLCYIWKRCVLTAKYCPHCGAKMGTNCTEELDKLEGLKNE